MQDVLDSFRPLPPFAPEIGSAPDGAFSFILDQIDYGMLLLGSAARVIHANQAAAAALRSPGPLRVGDGVLDATSAQDAAALRRALDDAGSRGLRALLTLGHDAQRLRIAVVPGGARGSGSPLRTLVVMGKRAVCETLSAQWFARTHGLTLAEARVLNLLCGGAAVADIARQHAVAVCTVRTQIGSIRAKTGANNIGALVRQVATLPPMVHALGTGMSA